MSDIWTALQDAGLSLDPVQDALDGAALRRLREALPEGWTVAVSTEAASYRGAWMVSRRRSGTDEAASEHYAATIAEAADACREALPKVPA